MRSSLHQWEYETLKLIELFHIKESLDFKLAKPLARSEKWIIYSFWVQSLTYYEVSRKIKHNNFEDNINMFWNLSQHKKASLRWQTYHSFIWQKKKKKSIKRFIFYTWSKFISMAIWCPICFGTHLFTIKFAKGNIKKRSLNSQLLVNRKQTRDGNSVSLWIMHRGFQSTAQ